MPRYTMRPITAAELIYLDDNLEVVRLAQTPDPEKLVYQAAKCDYSEIPVHKRKMSGIDFGRFIVEELLGNDRGHWGPLEHPSVTFSVSGFVHNVVVQARTHRVGVSFDVQSQRYTGKRVIQCADAFDEDPELEQLFYFRPVGYYVNRQGAKYEYTEKHREKDKQYCFEACKRYKAAVEQLGLAEEHARDLLPQNIRQNFVVSFNLRSVLHFLDLRSKRDAQLEIQALCEMLAPLIHNWAPNVWEYYEKKRLYKARLAP